MTKKIAFSASRLKDFNQCPFKFYQKNIAKTAKEKPTAASDYGSWVHKRFEESIRTGQPIKGTLKEHDPIAARFRTTDGKSRVFAEKKLALSTEMDPVEYFDPLVRSRSVADVLQVSAKALFVMDWKTGKMRDDDQEQLALTLSMAMMHYPDVEKGTAALYYTKTKDLVPLHMDRSLVIPIYSEFERKGQKIDEAAEKAHWPKRPSGLCGWCPVAPNKCEHKRAVS